MRISKLFVLALAATTVLISTSCKKSNDTTNNAAVSATIGGTVFTPATSLGIFYQSNNYYVLGGYSIKGTDTTLLEVSFPGGFKLNTPITTASSDPSIDYFIGGKDYYASYTQGTAMVTVTSLDSTNHKIAGTFTASMYAGASDSLVLTNGKFNLGYTVTP